MKLKTIIPTAFLIAMIIQSHPSAYAAQPNTSQESQNPSGSVIRVDIQNKDGSVKTLEGEEAQAWYNHSVSESQKRVAADALLQEPTAKRNYLPWIALSLVGIGALALLSKKSGPNNA